MCVEYFDENGDYIIEDEGYLFINGCCVAEPLTDLDCDRYAIEVQNGDGYYNSFGSFVGYSKE